MLSNNSLFMLFEQASKFAVQLNINQYSSEHTRAVVKCSPVGCNQFTAINIVCLRLCLCLCLCVCYDTLTSFASRYIRFRAHDIVPHAIPWINCNTDFIRILNLMDLKRW